MGRDQQHNNQDITTCPSCGSKQLSRLSAMSADTHNYKCSDCGRMFNTADPHTADTRTPGWTAFMPMLSHAEGVGSILESLDLTNPYLLNPSQCSGTCDVYLMVDTKDDFVREWRIETARQQLCELTKLSVMLLASDEVTEERRAGSVPLFDPFANAP